MSITSAYRGGYQNRPGWWIAIDFDADTVEGIKRAVASGDRTWDPDSKRWWIALEHEAAVLTVLPGFEAYLAQGSLF